MKRPVFLLLTSVFCLLASCSCSSCSQLPTVDPNAITAFTDQVEALSASVDAYQLAATAAIESLQDANAIDPAVAAATIEANADIDQLQAMIADLTGAMQSADFSGSSGLAALLQAAQAANQSSTGWNPYSGLIAALLTIVSAGAGVYAKRKASEASAAILKYQAHKQGVERTMKLASASEVPDVKKFETALYDAIGDARRSLGVK